MHVSKLFRRKLRNHLPLLIALILFNTQVKAQVNLPAPAEYLGYELGEHFTSHNNVLGYFKEIAALSPLVSYKKYGTTYEGRELGVVFVSSEENQSRLEEIRINNIKRAGLIEGEPSGEEIAIVWLSYNVHGDEASSSEAAMKTLYELARSKNERTKQWLQNTVVIMDPMLNPDGRERYVDWYNHVVGEQPNVHHNAREHHQPWPGGRTNHYYFALNRDWAWLTQKASRQRVDLYQKWLPHIHVDFHEMGINSPYYFAPAAQPYHRAITEWQRKFQTTIGKNNAYYFDKNNWLYFTGEVYDLFYPAYGDTYPIFNGAIGMTYEQAGGGFAGLAVLTADGDTLTLHDRLIHHFTTSLATIEAASNHAEQLVSEFEAYYEKAINKPGDKYKSFIIHSDSSKRIRSLLHLLDQHRIWYGRVEEPGEYEGFSYQTGEITEFEAKEGDIVISLYQPKSVLARVLFEPDPVLVDSVTYDITAWALPYAYGLDAFATTERIDGSRFLIKNAVHDVTNDITGEPYAYLVEWKNFGDVKLLAALLKKNITVRFAMKPFSTGGRRYKAGTLIITRAGNTEWAGKFDKMIQQTAAAHNTQIYPVVSGLVTSGSDFGSSNVHLVSDPRIALLTGTGTSSNMVGQVWHYFDRQIEYPATLISSRYFNDVDLHKYDVLIFPSADYDEILNEERLKEIKEWISSGGKLIAIGGANRFLADTEEFALQEKKEAVDSTAIEKDDYEERLKSFGNRRRRRIAAANPGSIYNVAMDSTHPLSFGYDDTYASLKLSTAAYAFLKDGWNVGVIKKNAPIAGFTGYKAKEKLENTLVFGVQNMGDGTVVYLIDNPLFRAFWYNGKLLFSNAVFMVGQ